MAVRACSKHCLVNLLEAVVCLPVQSHHLHTAPPENVGVEVGRIETQAFWIDTEHVTQVVIFELCLFLGILAKTASFCFVKREYMVVFSTFGGDEATVFVTLEVDAKLREGSRDLTRLLLLRLLLSIKNWLLSFGRVAFFFTRSACTS